MDSSEQHLVEQLKRGDGSAVRRWYALCARELTQFISLKVSTPKDVEELVQETFIHCLKNITLFEGRASLITWMKSVARHEVADFYRKKYAKKAIQTLSLNHLVMDTEVKDAHEVSERVKAVLVTMRHDYVELLLLKYVDGKSVKHIARELRRTVKSVEADLFRARQDFKTLYAIAETR